MKKVLLIFDLNHTLLYAAKNSKTLTFDYNSKIQDSKPNCFMEKDKIFFRPSRNEFLDYLFIKSDNFYNVGVWSSLDKEKTSVLSK